jgi:2-keto-4-pentenoate hydratase/2-oxohepta-3-ene-1,7-dioic acid hydratase in catechol pathway
MRLASYGEPRHERAAILIGDELVDLAEALGRLGVPISQPSVLAFLQRDDWRQVGQEIELTGAPGARRVSSAERIGAPIPLPGKLLAAGANTHSHVREAASLTRGVPPKEPMIFAKANSSVTGPSDSVVRPPSTRKLDYEVELAVVIGREARRVSDADAHRYIAGYMASNDVSARDVQLAEHEDNPFYRTHFLGKSFDTFCPTGPYLVTAEDAGAVQNARLRTWVNDELRQDGSVADLCHSVSRLVSYISAVMTLFPGDVICTGSPSGVANFMDPPAFVEPGDVVVCEVEGIGRLSNPIVG